MSAGTAVRPALFQANLQKVDLVRITGSLAQHASLRFSAGPNPRGWIVLHIVPPRGLPYEVLQDLGTDPTDHMHAQARLCGLRAGALVSASGSHLRYVRDHGLERLVLEGCTTVITHATA